MNTYKTSEVAKVIGIHPNTVRFYEQWGLIPSPHRKPNGYRVFTDFHIDQLKLARTALKIEVVQNGLRKKILEAVKNSAAGDFDEALILATEYYNDIKKEKNNAEEAIQIAKDILKGNTLPDTHGLRRKEVSKLLNISMDTLRNWELNGLLSVKRKENGYRFYTDKDIQQLKIIRSLRCANYSLEAILRMINALSANPETNIRKVLNTPSKDTDIISVCDKLITSLQEAGKNAASIIKLLKKIKNKYSNPPL